MVSGRETCMVIDYSLFSFACSFFVLFCFVGLVQLRRSKDIDFVVTKRQPSWCTRILKRWLLRGQ